MKCPHCGKETSDYRIAISKLANGKYTVNEMAEMLGKDSKTIRATMNVMIREGDKLKFKPDPRYDPKDTLKKELFVINQIIKGAAVKDIAEKLEVTSTRVGQIRDRALRKMRREAPEIYAKYQNWAKENLKRKPKFT